MQATKLPLKVRLKRMTPGQMVLFGLLACVFIWFINRDGNLFYLYYVRDNRKHMIIIEPSEEMVDMFRKYLEPGVFQG